MLFPIEDGGPMEVVLACPACGTCVTSTRFCTACGVPLPAGDLAQVPEQRAPVLAPDDGWLPSGAAPADASDPGVDTVVRTDGVPWPAPWPAYPPPGATAQPGPRARHPWRTVLAVLVVGALALSCWVLMHGGERHVLSGTVLLADSSFAGLDPGDDCRGTGGYGDIDAGTQVVLTDATGTTISTTALSGGTFDGKGCVFSFLLRDVRHSDFYGLAVAGSNRGRLQYSYDDLAHESWSLSLSLGQD
jgi:hypothetical protein